MSRIDADRIRPVGGAESTPPRSEAGMRFDAALRRDPNNAGSDTDADGGSGGRSPGNRARYDLMLPGQGLPGGLFGLFRETIERGLPGGPVDESVLEGLLRDIADGVRTGRQLPGDRWRLLVRLREELLPATEVDIAGVEGQLSVVLRTAREDAYRTIVEALPRLNQSLRDLRVAGTGTTVFLVAAEDLQ